MSELPSNRAVSLFAGIGGFDLGLERAGWRIALSCEIDARCRATLRHQFPGVGQHDDIGTLSLKRGFADLVCGGFPCQRFSTASRGRRVAPDLWPEMLRVIDGVQPRYVIAENVLGLGLDGVDRVCGDLEALGYTVWPYRLDVAPRGRHRGRWRYVFVAHAHVESEPRRAVDAEVAGLCGLSVCRAEDSPAPVGVDDGLPGRMDRLARLGNAIPPQVPEVIGRVLLAWGVAA